VTGLLTRWVPEPLVVLATAVRVEVLLHTTDLPTACRRLGVVLDVRTAVRHPPEPAELPRWARAPARWTDVLLGRWPFGDTCLRRCLVLGSRLRGLDPVLRLGARRTGSGAIVAHAWLEIAGRSLDGTLGDVGPFEALA